MNRKPTPLDWHISLPTRFPPRYPLPKTGRLVTSPLDVDEVGSFRGETRHPTPTDGWLVTGRITPTERGLIISELTIKPSGMVWDNGRQRRRTNAERDVDINSSVLRLIDLTQIRNEYRREVEVLTEAAHLEDHASEDEWRRVGVKVAKDRHRGTVNTPDRMYELSQDVIRESKSWRGMRKRLATEWGVSPETVKTRMRRLRSDGWISGATVRTMPGPAYTRHEQTRQTDTPKEQT